MVRGFETGSDNERIDELQRQLDDIIDSQINSVGGNEDISIDSTRGSRNNASGDAGGVRSNQPVIHQITDVDEGGTPTGVFDKINLVSSMIIVDFLTPAVDMELRFIQGTAKDGARAKITPKLGRTLIIKSGGNILTSDDITVSDTEFYELIKHSEAETGVTGGAYKISLGSSGGGGSTPPFTDATPLIFDSVDPTKLSKFDNGLITTATTRTYILPDSDTILAGLAVLSQEWFGSNLFSGGATVRDGNFFIQDSVDITKQARFDAGLITSGQTRIYTLPDSSTTLAGLGVPSQTFTGSNTFLGTETKISSTLFTVESALTTIGNAPSDILNIIAGVGSSLIPTLTDSFQIGSSSLQWSKIFIKEIDATTETTITSALLTIESALTTFGNSTGDIFNFVGRIGSSLIPTLDASFALGSVSLEWNNLFIATINAFTETTVSSPIFSIDSSIINLGNATSDAVNILGTIQTNVLLDGGKRIRSDDSSEIGFFVTNFTGSVGTAGSNQSPVIPTMSATVSNMDNSFGSEIGCHGVFNTSNSFINIAWKIGASEWLILACPDAGGNVVSDHIT